MSGTRKYSGTTHDVSAKAPTREQFDAAWAAAEAGR